MRKIIAFVALVYAFITLLRWVDYGEISIMHPIIVIVLSIMILVTDEKEFERNFYNYKVNNVDKELQKKALKKYNKNKWLILFLKVLSLERKK